MHALINFSQISFNNCRRLDQFNRSWQAFLKLFVKKISIFDRERCKTVNYAEPSPGFAATPQTFRCPPDPAWTVSALSTKKSDSSDEETVVSPIDQETLDVYNTAMSTLATASSSADTFTPLTSRLKTSWNNATELDRQKCEEKARQGCLLVCEVVAPNARHDLFDALCKSRPKKISAKNLRC